MTDITSQASSRLRSRPDLMDPQTLSQLGGVELIARQVVEGFIMGLHRSPHRGFSAEFAELRAYQPGDDLRHIDWRMFGRSDRYYVKQFEEETNLRAYILVDVSTSMGWSSNPDSLPTKLWYAKHLAASLSLILLRQGDAVGLAAFHDQCAIFDGHMVVARVAPRGGQRYWHETVVARVAPRGGQRYWHEILRRAPLKAQGRTSAHPALRDIAIRLRRAGLVVLLSDLLVDPETTRTALRFLRHQGHEVLVFHLIDPGERELPAAGDTRFYDPETAEELNVNVADVRSAYRNAVRDALAEWDRGLRPHGIDYVIVGTETPLSRALRFYLRKREHLG